MRSQLISIVKLASPHGLIFRPVSVKHGLQTVDHGLGIMDCGLGIKHGLRLGIKCGLWTEYKTRTRYKTRTIDHVYKNSFRKVKLTEMESRLAKTVVPALTFL